MKTLIMILSLSLLLPQQSNADNYKEAQTKALTALYIQSGYKYEVDQITHQFNSYLKTLDKRYVPEYLRTPGGVLIFAAKIIKDQQLVCKWEF